MRGTDQQTARLKELVARNRKLAGEIQGKSAQMDQLFAAQKDVLRSSYESLSGSAGQSSLAKVPSDSPSREKQPSAYRPPVLVVVEDDPDDFLLIKRALWKAGSPARVWWAHDGSEALSILAEVEPSARTVCVLADLQLPGMDGFELLALVRERNSRPGRVKFAFLTGREDEAAQARAYAQGADRFFVKPSDPVDLIRVAREVQKLATE